ncbi:MAG TPA: hypothetical protein VJA00_00545, partial [Candidatus Omnitrophota bacterium]|nr:hypothetical protein [Candidatus Omnitrophota bacterium]
PGGVQLWHQTEQAIANADPTLMSNQRFQGLTTSFLGILALPPEEQDEALRRVHNLFNPFFGPRMIEPTTSPFPYGNRTGGDKARPFDYDSSFLNPFEKDSSNLHQVIVDPNDLILALWRAGVDQADIDKFIEDWKKAVYSADWDDKDRISTLDQQWQEIINKLIQGIQNQEAFVSAEATDVFVLDVVDFTNQIQAIHRLLNPPDRLHPWLKWLLYLSRVSPEMLQFYQAALEGRDRIYTLASKSDGRLKIRYQGRIMDIPIFIWPDDAEGSYELVMVRDQRALTSSHSSAPVAQAGSALPPQ